ncbi:MAG: hypothetical protein ACXABO_11660 [Promethearchaeota archaeon]|jgi:hypothetical protein
MKLRKPEINVDPETRNLIISFILTGLITYIITYSEVWQLIIIPGFIGGLLNKSMRKGIYSGVLGVFLVWILYVIYFMVEKSAYINLDQFAGLIFGELGYGWVILVLIFLFGILFGALGGAIGSGVMLFLRPKLVKIKSEGKPPVR